MNLCLIYSYLYMYISLLAHRLLEIKAKPKFAYFAGPRAVLACLFNSQVISNLNCLDQMRNVYLERYN